MLETRRYVTNMVNPQCFVVVTFIRPTKSDTQGDTQGNTQGDTQGDTKGGTQGGTKDVTKQLSERQKFILQLIEEDAFVTTNEMSLKTSVTTRTIKRGIEYLQEQRIIVREGGREEGRWIIVDKQSDKNRNANSCFRLMRKEFTGINDITGL